MMSRLKKLNTRQTLPLLVRSVFWVYRGTAGGADAHGSGVTVTITLAGAIRDRIPPSVMPWSALEQTDQRQPAPPHEPELGQRLDGVLTAGRSEAACRQAQRRHRAAVELDRPHQRADGAGSHSGIHEASARLLMRRNAVRICCSSRGDTAWRL